MTRVALWEIVNGIVALLVTVTAAVFVMACFLTVFLVSWLHCHAAGNC